MRFTRRSAIGAGLGAVVAPAGWAQNKKPVATLPIIISKSGHVLAKVRLGREDCYALLDNSQATAISVDAPGLTTSHRRSIRNADEGAEYVPLTQPYDLAFVDITIAMRLAVRGLRTYSEVNELPVQMIMGWSVFEQTVVELDFRNKLLRLHLNKRFAEPAGAESFVSESATPGLFRVPIQIGPEVKGLAAVSLGYPGVISINHPRVGAWINDGRPVRTKNVTLVYGSMTTRQEQIAFRSPPLKVGPFDLGEVEALVGVSQEIGADATLGVAAMQAFHSWLEGARDRIWMQADTDGRFNP